jgi:hypothetical protein
LPNIVVIPRARKRSNVASLTVVMKRNPIASLLFSSKPPAPVDSRRVEAEPMTTGSRRGVRLLALAVAALLSCWAAEAATAGPLPTRVSYATGEIVPIPAAIPHEEGDMVDRRILPDLRWIAGRFPIYITDGYSGPLPDGAHVGCHGCHVRHSDHYNGLAVDIVPLRWSDRCDRNWRGITRLAHWAEPRQNRPRPPFRWVGYNGDTGHGCGNHLHLSWAHAPAPQFELAEWVEVFPVGSRPPAPRPRPNRKSAQPKPEVEPKPKPPTGPAGGVTGTPSGGVSTARLGGVSARGD